ncbi:MAG: hypothetical protein MJZ25_16595 [Fibrobacter sp.]|nr:hypothetical protein [Fibrobacter sp.]
MHQRKGKIQTDEQKLEIVMEYRTGSLSLREVAKKHGIRSHATIINWELRLLGNRKALSLRSNNSATSMGNEKKSPKQTSREELEKQLEELRVKLARKELELEAVNTLVDIAEKHGYQIRKNSGAKQ